MRTTVKLPKVADTADVVVVEELLVAVGDTVAEGTPLAVVETDKASVEVPSPVAGTVAELLVAPGDEIVTGSPVAVLTTG